MSSHALVPAAPGRDSAQLVVTAEDFMPFKVSDVVARKETIDNIIANLLVPGVDFGEQPGSSSKQKVLKKSGAEKLCSAFGLAPKIIKESKVKDWTGADHGGEPFFEYEYQLALCRGDRFFGEATASCNSWERKFRYQWVSEEEAKDRPDFEKLPKRGGKKTLFEPDFALDKRETTGRYGKPLEYWRRFDDARTAGTARRTQKQLGKKAYDGYQIEVDDTLVRIPNPNAADSVNTVQKMAYKRALVAAVVVVTNCSDAFTQDVDEEDESTQPRETENPREPVVPGPDIPPPTKREMRGDVGHETPPRPVPAEMQEMIDRVRRDPRKELKEAYDEFWRRFQKCGEDAARAHEFLNQQFRNRFPKGSGKETLEDHVSHLVALNELLGSYTNA